MISLNYCSRRRSQQDDVFKKHKSSSDEKFENMIKYDISGYVMYAISFNVRVGIMYNYVIFPNTFFSSV